VPSYDVLKTNAARIAKLDVEMYDDESSKPVNFGVKRSKFKVTRHKNKYVSLQMEHLITTCCVHKLYSPLQYLSTQAMLVTLDFLHYFPQPMLLSIASFSMHGVICSQPVATNIAGMDHGALVSAGFL